MISTSFFRKAAFFLFGFFSFFFLCQSFFLFYSLLLSSLLRDTFSSLLTSISLFSLTETMSEVIKKALLLLLRERERERGEKSLRGALSRSLSDFFLVFSIFRNRLSLHSLPLSLFPLPQKTNNAIATPKRLPRLLCLRSPPALGVEQRNSLRDHNPGVPADAVAGLGRARRRALLQTRPCCRAP